MTTQPHLTILKIGGNVLADADLLRQALALFKTYTGAAILVHGGGKRATELLEVLGIPAQMVNGRRITDAATLEIVTMVYAGLINKTLVAQLQAIGCNAIGVSGADANLIQAHKRRGGDIDYGFAGDVDVVNAEGFAILLEAGMRPVCCAITHDKNGQLLNTNADTIAASIARGMAATHRVQLHYCFEKPGVLLDVSRDDSVIADMDRVYYQQLKQEGAIHSGMLPKLDNAFEAIQNGVEQVWIGNIDSLQTGSATRLH
ncbi:MAG: acetylglutamate kinase [Saprospiraceae bacterium]